MRIRRQKSDKMDPKCEPVRVLKSRPVRVAEMGQVDAASRAAHTLGRRVAQDGLIQVGDIGGKLAGTRFEQVDERTSLRWFKDDPSLPERMIRTGQMTREDFPKLFRSYLHE
jgi:hypothetical protein